MTVPKSYLAALEGLAELAAERLRTLRSQVQALEEHAAALAEQIKHERANPTRIRKPRARPHQENTT